MAVRVEDRLTHAAGDSQPRVKTGFEGFRQAVDLLPFQSAFGIRQPVALAVGFQDVNTMSQTVQQCSGQSFAAQHFGPLFKGQVDGNDLAVY